jgi:rubrerythrin
MSPSKKKTPARGAAAKPAAKKKDSPAKAKKTAATRKAADAAKKKEAAAAKKAADAAKKKEAAARKQQAAAAKKKAAIEQKKKAAIEKKAAAAKKAAEIATKKAEEAARKKAEVTAERERKKAEEKARAAKKAEEKEESDRVAAEKKRERQRAKAPPPSGPRHPKLGFKWNCFSCGAKFYDLDKPEPVCPKCGEDQRDRPLNTPSSTPTPPRKAPVRPMPMLEDEEEVATTAADDTDFDIDEADDTAALDDAIFKPVAPDEDDADAVDPDDISI